MALEMSPKYIRNLHLPDKAIGWLDTASVKVEINELRIWNGPSEKPGTQAPATSAGERDPRQSDSPT